MYLSGDGARARITPAYAGKSFTRNEHLKTTVRITPAYAGKSASLKYGEISK